jgi:hypothetical protein
LDQPNAFASIALILWVPISAVLFGVLRPALATALVLLGGMMFLPERVVFEIRGFPELGKQEIAILCALAGCLATCPARIAAAKPGRGPEGSVILLIAAGFGTALTNGDPLFYGPVIRPALSLYDAIAMAARDLLRFALPFLLGRALFRSRRDLRDLLVLLALAGLLYSVLVVFEARMSPQLNNWLYGFHQHSWLQTFRGGGFRPVVFMHHGLALALFMLVTAIAATSLARARCPILGVPSAAVALYLSAVLLLCRSLAALAYGAFVLPLVTLATPLWQTRAAVALAVLVAVYPVLRAADLFPTASLASLAEGISVKRAASLAFRLRHEDRLLTKAQERIAFGWGAWGRNELYSETGKNVSVTDGFWIIQLGQRGIVGLAVPFALLLVPVWIAWRDQRSVERRFDRWLLAGLSLIVVFYAVDLLPNGLFTSFPLFLAGALFGLAPAVAQRRIARSRANSRRGTRDMKAAPSGQPGRHDGSLAAPRRGFGPGIW